jgi:hypothetical protein
MSLATCFQQTSESYIVRLNYLVKNQPYPITCVERCDNRYGPTVLLTIQESKKVFLPRRYSEIMTDENLENINSGNKIWSRLHGRVSTDERVLGCNKWRVKCLGLFF